MDDISSRPIHTVGTVDEFFFFEGHLLSTRSADAYKAVDKVTKSSVLLWRLRHPLIRNNEAINRFLGRMENICAMDPPIAEIDSYEIDAAGIAFAVMPQLHGQPFGTAKLEASEAERQFISCMRYVARLHEQGIVCGDLGTSSFWVNRSGDVQFIGVMGSFDVEAAATTMLPPVETLTCLAPEQRTGGTAIPASDVFSLAVLGYFLFTGEFPYGDPGDQEVLDPQAVKPLSAFMARPPVWAEELFKKALHPDPESRYSNVVEMIQAVNFIRQQSLEAASVPARIGALSGQDKARSTSSVHMPVSTSARVREERDRATQVDEPEAPAKPQRLRLIAVFATVFIATFAVILKMTESREQVETKLQKDLRVHMAATDSDQMKQAISDIAQPELALEEKTKQLEQIAKSDDPLSHAVLLRTALDAPTLEERDLAERAILARAMRLGLNRSAEQVRQWLRVNANGAEKPASYEAVLKTLDTSLPSDLRAGLLRDSYQSNPRIVLRLIAALAIDMGKPQDFQPLLAELLQDPLGQEDLKNRSTISLIIAYSELSLIFGEDAIQFKDTIPNDDVLWLTRILAERSDAQLKTLAAMASERSLLSPLRQIFIAPLMNKPDIPVDIAASLIRASAGALRKEDVTRFGRWFDADAEKILLSICADNYDRDVLVEAFDIVAGKNPVIEPAATMIAWIRSDYWEERGEFVHALGVLSALSVMSLEDVRRAVAVFERFSGDKRFLKALIGTNHPLVLRVVLEKYPGKVGLAGLVELLDFPDKEIRLMTIKVLSPYNDIAALKLIIERYESERDPEVRKAYEESFWVIKERSRATR